MPLCSPERERQLLSLMWSTANLNRFSAGPLRDAMLMKEDTVGSPPPSQHGLADCKAGWKVEGKCFIAEWQSCWRQMQLLTPKDHFCQVILLFQYQNVIYALFSFFHLGLFLFIYLLQSFPLLKNNVWMYICSTEWIHIHVCTYMHTYVCVCIHFILLKTIPYWVTILLHIHF